MKTELLRQVKDAETAAADHIASAEEEARKIVSDARRQAEKVLADGRTSADAARQAKLDAARADVAEETKKILAGGKRQITSVRKKFDAGIEGVTDRVVGLLEESL